MRIADIFCSRIHGDPGTYFGLTADFYDRAECQPVIWGNQAPEKRLEIRKEALLKVEKRFPRSRTRISCLHHLAARH